VATISSRVKEGLGAILLANELTLKHGKLVVKARGLVTVIVAVAVLLLLGWGS
jgi:hypothetical protein